jgi:two-component system chemotaxis sensor kinase CheA
MSLESDATPAATLPAPTNASAANPLASDPELLNDFILESREHLTSIELQLLTLDQDAANAEAIHSIFRGFHTIKGMAGFLDLDAIRNLAHEVETVLDLARNARLVITPAVIDRILESKDYLIRWMSELESMLATGQTPALAENPELLSKIRSLASGGAAASAADQARPAREEDPSPSEASATEETAASEVATEARPDGAAQPRPDPATGGLQELGSFSRSGPARNAGERRSRQGGRSAFDGSAIDQSADRQAGLPGGHGGRDGDRPIAGAPRSGPG